MTSAERPRLSFNEKDPLLDMPVKNLRDNMIESWRKDFENIVTDTC